MHNEVVHIIYIYGSTSISQFTLQHHHCEDAEDVEREERLRGRLRGQTMTGQWAWCST